MPSYSFNFQIVKSVRYLIYGAILGFSLIVTLLLCNVLNIVLIILAVFVPFIVGGGLFYQKGKGSDQIVLDNGGFTSSFFGRVEYKEIDRIPHPAWFGAPAPSLKIVLKSGRKLVWGLSDIGSVFNTSSDAVIFRNFIDDLHVHLERDIQSAAPEKDSQLVNGDLVSKESPSWQLDKIKTKYSKQAIIWPVGILFSILIFVKTCGTDFIRENKDREIKEAFRNSELRYKENIEASKLVLDSFAKTLGPVYLYSNDQDIDVLLLPIIKEENTLDRVPALKHAITNVELRKFIQHPDSAQFVTVLLDKHKDMMMMKKSMMNYGDSSNTFLFLRFYDPSQKLNPDPYVKNKPVDSSTFVTFDVTTAVMIKKGQSVSESLENSVVSLKMMLAQARLRPAFRIYLSGAQYNNVSKGLFDEVVVALKKKLVAVEVDTSQFSLKVHNQ